MAATTRRATLDCSLGHVHLVWQHSLLPYHIMNQVVEAVKAGKDFETCVLNFAQVLAAYNKKEWQIWPCNVTKVVATFTSYCLN